MRAREMHPLCCITIDSPWISDPDPDPEPAAGAPDNADGSDVVVAGVLHKWTHFGRGWRSRWFSLRNGVLTYAKIQSPPKDNPDPDLDPPPLPEDVRLIGSTPTARSLIGIQQQQKTIGFVCLKISSFRESKSDDRRFYIFSPTKTLHLRTGSKEDRVAWIEALVSARSKFSLYDKLSLVQNDASFSTTKLRDRMQSEGLGQAVIKDCEQIMQSEFSEFQRQLKLRYEEHLHLVGTFRQHLENVNVGDETRSIREGQLQLMKHEFSSSGRGKYSEYCTTESSEDVEKQELDDSSDEEPCFYDTKEGFPESHGTNPSSLLVSNHTGAVCRSENHLSDPHIMHTEREPHVMYAEREHTEPMLSYIERRKELPQPIEKEKAANLWSVIKDNVGKDLTRVCLPVYFNEPLSSLQKCFEDLEYSHLLDQAYEYGKMGNSLMRILNIAAFAVSGYASSDGRPCKPFNPLLGETYEADFPEKGIRFFSEKVSHHPMLIACHCEGKGWKFWGDSNLRSKFWGRSIQLDPVGVLTLEFDDGEIFQWSKVTTSIYNLILGKVYCDHHGTMSIQGNREYSCKLKFKEQSLFDRNPRQVQGFMEDTMGNKVAALVGKWDDSLYYVTGHDVSKTKGCISTENATLLWRRSKPPENPTRYNLSSFAITLNELTSGLQGKLPPTDSRLRPDQRYLENGEYEKAFVEKLRLETRQRMSCKLQENGWKPRWFQKDTETGTFRYMGGYWEASEQKKWEDCPDIFGEFSVDLNTTCD